MRWTAAGIRQIAAVRVRGSESFDDAPVLRYRDVQVTDGQRPRRVRNRLVGGRVPVPLIAVAVVAAAVAAAHQK